MTILLQCSAATHSAHDRVSVPGSAAASLRTGSVIRSVVAPAQFAVDVGAMDAALATAKPRDSVVHRGCRCGQPFKALWTWHKICCRWMGEWGRSELRQYVVTRCCRRQSGYIMHVGAGRSSAICQNQGISAPHRCGQPSQPPLYAPFGCCAPLLVRVLPLVRGGEAWRATWARISGQASAAAGLAAFSLPYYALQLIGGATSSGCCGC